MKVLMISVKAGYGHHSTAQAIMECLAERGIESTMLDTFDYIDPKLGSPLTRRICFQARIFRRSTARRILCSTRG